MKHFIDINNFKKYNILVENEIDICFGGYRLPLRNIRLGAFKGRIFEDY